MKITFNGSNTKINDAIEFSNEILSIDEFWEEVSEVAQFDYTKLSTSDIVERIRTYRPRWRWSKANAYVSDKFPNTLFLNSRKLWRSTASMVNTIIHECVHIADFADSDREITFGHGDNSSIGKQNSAPYWIGNKAEELFVNLTPDAIEIEKVELEEALIDK